MSFEQIPIVYVAGPYRSPTLYGVTENIRRARELGIRVWAAGGAAIVPHANTALMDGAMGLKDDAWLNGDLAMILRCDAMLMVAGWEDSVGATAERRLALERSIPVFETFETFERWLKDRLATASLATTETVDYGQTPDDWIADEITTRTHLPPELALRGDD